jgi:DNA-binding transcriptional ArsR family regulator
VIATSEALAVEDRTRVDRLRVARLFHAVADETRLRILDQLRGASTASAISVARWRRDSRGSPSTSRP